MGFEESLIRHAAPTLAGIKVSSLYNYHFSSMAECEQAIFEMNNRLNPKGVFVRLMNHKKDFYLIYIYREKQLLDILTSPEVRDFLLEYEYGNCVAFDASDNINVLKRRIGECACFPHEIGVFLGYPLADVKEFINRGGDGYLISGEWKVYNDVKAAMCFFCKLKKCKEVYIRTYNTGRTLSDMTVAS